MFSTELLVLFAASFPFLPILWGNFVFDDFEAIVNNPVVNGHFEIKEVLWRDFWGRNLSSEHSHKSYRPLTSLLFRWQWRLFGGRPEWMHGIGVGLHVFISLLVLKMVRLMEEELKLKTNLAGIVGLAFALHPVHIEAVANITCQAELFSAVFHLLGIIFYISYCQRLVFLKLSLLFFLAVASLLSKEQGIAFLPICCVLALLLNRRSHVLPFVINTILLALLRATTGAPRFSSLDNPAAFVENPLFRWQSFSWQWLLHIQLLVAPFQFCFDYSMGCVPPISSYSDPRNIFLYAFFISVPVGAFRFYRNLEFDHQKMFLVAFFFGLISFFPASNILLTVGFSVAERVLYLPSIGFCLLFSILWRKLEKIHGKMDSHAIVLVTIAILLCSQRSREWTTELSLYSSGLKICPNNAKIHYNLAKILADEGRETEAEKEYREAIRLYPQYEQALNNLGNLLEKKGHFNESEVFLRAAIATQPRFATAWMNLGITMMNVGKYNDSLFAYKESLRHRPKSADCYFNLGNLYQRMGEMEEAAKAWKRAIDLHPSHCSAWTNFFVVLDELSLCHVVLSFEKDALLFCSSTPAVRSQLGVCYVHRNDYEAAEKHLLTAISLAPENQAYQSNYDVFLGLKSKRKT